MLDQAVAGVVPLLQLATVLGVRSLSDSQQEVSMDLNRETSSSLPESEVFGREDDIKKIINWLKQPAQSWLSSFGIIGVGGLGKTTLAQHAYQQMHVSNYFDEIIWVCVSTSFTVERITRNLLSELGESGLGDKPLNALQECLKEKIISKKILIILDDVCDDKKRDGWEKFFASLRCAKEGSKILFTTRMESVAKLLASVINTKQEYLYLEGLDKQQLRLLFNSYAFRGSNPDNHGDLEEIGDQIVKRLRGNPLAAKMIGGLVNSKLDYDHWNRILNHDSLFKIEQPKNEIEVMKLSNAVVCFNGDQGANGVFCESKEDMVAINPKIDPHPQPKISQNLHLKEKNRFSEVDMKKSILFFENSAESQAIEDGFKKCVVMKTNKEFSRDRVADSLNQLAPNFSWKVSEIADYLLLIEGPGWWREKVIREEEAWVENEKLPTFPWNSSYKNEFPLKSLWVRVVGFPIKLWHEAEFKKLIDGFGILLEIDRQTLDRSSLKEAKIKIGVCNYGDVPVSKQVVFLDDRQEYCWSNVRFLFEVPVDPRKVNVKRKIVGNKNSNKQGDLDGSDGEEDDGCDNDSMELDRLEDESNKSPVAAEEEYKNRIEKLKPSMTESATQVIALKSSHDSVQVLNTQVQAGPTGPSSSTREGHRYSKSNHRSTNRTRGSLRKSARLQGKSSRRQQCITDKD